MSAHLNTPIIERSCSHSSVWHRLHSEREDICEVLLKESEPASAKASAAERATQTSTGNWHVELLHERLRKVDDALDRILSGSYGDCVKCGRWIEDTKLHFDPAIAFCVECWQRLQTRSTSVLSRKSEPVKAGSGDSMDKVTDLSPLLPGVALETLAPYDTIQVQTLNSHYGIFLLNPRIGRVLVEGGSYFHEPVEAVVYGSNRDGSTLRVGWIGIDMRIEMWVKGQLVSTSPVQSFCVQHLGDPEPASMMALRMQQR